jgi:hypothetical protein
VKCAWISQRVPLVAMSRNECLRHVCQQPQCQKVQILSVNSNFCADHACSECAVSRAESLVSPKSGPGDSRFCADHRCGVDECAEPRFRDGIDRCVYHLCRECAKGEVFRASDKQLPDSQLCSDLHRCQFATGGN